MLRDWVDGEILLSFNRHHCSGVVWSYIGKLTLGWWNFNGLPWIIKGVSSFRREVECCRAYAFTSSGAWFFTKHFFGECLTKNFCWFLHTLRRRALLCFLSNSCSRLQSRRHRLVPVPIPCLRTSKIALIKLSRLTQTLCGSRHINWTIFCLDSSSCFYTRNRPCFLWESELILLLFECNGTRVW